jgi:hypothetical protein
LIIVDFAKQPKPHLQSLYSHVDVAIRPADLDLDVAVASNLQVPRFVRGHAADG